MNAPKLIAFNFHFAVWLSILGGLAALNSPDIVVPYDDGLYGPLRNNFLIAIGYLLFSQVALWYLRYLRGSRIEALVMAYTFFATAVGGKVYALVNGVPVSNIFFAVLIYLAISHALYYIAGRVATGETDGPGSSAKGRASDL